MKIENNDGLHEERMQEIFKHSDRFNTNLLCYISGWMDNNPEFH